jgi:predicted phage baseplate assembly protein
MTYRSGGGIIGNVGNGTITQLKTSLNYVAGVTNYVSSQGGLNEEGIDQAKMRALSVLRHPYTAVTREDYERLAVEVEGVGRARCIAAGDEGNPVPGLIRLLVVPRLNEFDEVTANALAPSPDLIQRVAQELDDRKSLGIVVQIEPAPLVWAELDVHLFIRRGMDREAAEAEAVRRLRAIFHPTPANGGGTGGFGGSITVSQVHRTLQTMPGVVYVERVRLLRNGNTQEVTRIQPSPDALLVLGRCYVRAEAAEE